MGYPFQKINQIQRRHLALGLVLVLILAAGIFAYKRYKGPGRTVPGAAVPVRPGGAAVPAPGFTAAAVQAGINEAVALVRPAVVAVIAPGAGRGPGNPAGLAFISPAGTGNAVTGSGVIVDPAGYVLTTFQTVGKASRVKVRLFSAGPALHGATVLAVDTKTDLVLLKIDTPGVYPAASLGNSDATEIGDIVLAVGTPYGFSRSVSMGIISTNRRTVRINGQHYPDLIQTDAAINAGDDGGALVNIRGEVIGINMAYYIPNHHFTGIGFALPINDASGLLGRI